LDRCSKGIELFQPFGVVSGDGDFYPDFLAPAFNAAFYSEKHAFFPQFSRSVKDSIPRRSIFAFGENRGERGAGRK
jgi:hypothetical protein